MLIFKLHFEIKVGVHQGSALSPLIYIMTSLVDLDNYKCGHGYDGLAMFTEENITMR